MRSFFSIDGPLMRALSELANLLILNLLTMVCSLPVITAGAALASMHYCIMKMSDGEDSHIVKMYFAQFKGNLLTVTPAWIVFFGFAAFLFFDYQIFADSDIRSEALVLIYIALIICLAVYVWFFPLAARFENGFFAKFKNSFLMAIGVLPRTLGMMAIWMITEFVLSQSVRLFPLLVMFGLSLPAYLSVFLYYPVIKEQIKKTKGDKEEDLEKDYGEEE